MGAVKGRGRLEAWMRIHFPLVHSIRLEAVVDRFNAPAKRDPESETVPQLIIIIHTSLTYCRRSSMLIGRRGGRSRHVEPVFA
jgi:hypothetical protein